MAEQLPPDWAIERALSLCGSRYEDAAECRAYAARGNTVSKAFISFARYIAQHEEAPVDPLLIEAREIVAKGWGEGAGAGLADECRQGLQDNDSEVRMALAGLRRGIEIGKAS